MKKRIYALMISCVFIGILLCIAGCITPENKKPEASFTIEPSFVAAGESFYCNSTSEDADGSITNHTWIIDGTIIGYTSEITYVFNENGSYMITLQVKDDQGSTNSIEKNMIVGDEQLHYDKFYGEWEWSGNDQTGQWIFYENNTLKSTFTGMAGATTTDIWIWELWVNKSEIHFTTTDEQLFSGAYEYEFQDNENTLKITYDGSIAFWYRVE